MELKLIEREGIPQAVRQVAGAFFSGDTAQAERHFQGHADGTSTTLLGCLEGELVGILTIRWEPRYPPFRQGGIPLIQHIEVRWERRGQGIGGELMEEAERLIRARGFRRAGICVGLFDAYGPAQRLYARRGYVPDGRGVCRGHDPLHLGDWVRVDHDLLLWLVKDLDAEPR